MKISELHQKKKRKMLIDTNQSFASVESIKVVFDEQQRYQAERNRRDRAKEARKLANEMIAQDITRFQHEFHLNTIE